MIVCLCGCVCMYAYMCGCGWLYVCVCVCLYQAEEVVSVYKQYTAMGRKAVVITFYEAQRKYIKEKRIDGKWSHNPWHCKSETFPF